MVQNRRELTALTVAGLVSKNAFRFANYIYLLTTFYHALICCSSIKHNEIESS